MKIQVFNLQPDSITLPDGRSIAPEGVVARVSETLTPCDHVLDLDFPIFIQKLEVTINGNPFPIERKGIFYVVSLMVAQAMPNRKDLLVPVGQLRDENGRVIGCEGLAVNPAWTASRF